MTKYILGRWETANRVKAGQIWSRWHLVILGSEGRRATTVCNIMPFFGTVNNPEKAEKKAPESREDVDIVDCKICRKSYAFKRFLDSF